MAVSFIATFKYKKYDLAAELLGFGIVVVVMPVMFILSAGLDSGASVWLSLGILYIFVMFSGKRLWFFLGLAALSYGFTYWLTYIRPDLIVSMPSKAASYFDAFFSVFAVGVVADFHVVLPRERKP